jgi:hypothetical protein
LIGEVKYLITTATTGTTTAGTIVVIGVLLLCLEAIKLVIREYYGIHTGNSIRCESN